MQPETGDFDLIVGVGFLLADAMAEVCDQFPDQNFAIIDVTWLGKPNLMEIGYEENKGSALVGALGAMVAAHYGYDKNWCRSRHRDTRASISLKRVIGLVCIGAMPSTRK